jgi:diguanylate cyclase (GGDEF)-like protein
VQRVPGSERLDPRSSFELFLREHRGDSDPWPSVTPRVALELRDALKQAHWILRSRLDALELERSHLQALLAHEEMLHAALHDPLTGLANRRHLYERLRDGGHGSAGQRQPLALLHLDLDGFKAVNDSLGHEVGDQLLVQVAEILRDTVREHDLAVRLGGDEFVVLTDLAHDRAALEGLARRIIARVSRPHLIQEQVCRLGVSIGIALGSAQDPRASNLLRQSDVALYESKRRGKGCFTVYTQELDAAIREEQRLADELAVALQRGELAVHYQPQFLVESGALVGVEALLRWNHPRLGILQPSSFLPIAQKAGLLGEVDAHALQLIDRTYQRWLAEGIVVQKLSINVSAEQLCSAGFAEQVKALGIPPEVLSLELLESIYLDQPSPSVLAALQELKQLGVRIELDDFGSGHTSVLSLMAVQPDGLKVDKGLVIPALSCVETTRLLRLVVGMGHALEIDVTAEGVESPEHVALVKRLRCRRMQGYGLARPMQPEAFAQLMRAS